MPSLPWVNPITGAERVAGVVSGAVRMSERVVGEAPALMADARRLLSDAGRLLSDAGRLLPDAVRLVARVDVVLTQIESSVQAADAVIARCDEARLAAELVTASVGGVTARALGLLDDVEPPIRRLLPLLDEAARIDPSVVPRLVRLTELSDLVEPLLRLRPLLDATSEMDPRLVRALDKATPLLASIESLAEEASERFAGALSDTLEQTPKLMAQVSDEVVPALQSMVGAIPDVQELRQVVDRLEPMMVEVGQVLAGLPGAKRMRRRGEQELDDIETD